MSLQSCRPSVARCRHASRILTSCARAFATESTPSSSTPESFKVPAGTTTSTTTTTEPTTTTYSSSATTTKPKPRWSHTPEGMKAPLQLDFAKSPRNKVWAVNNDPARLDDVYNRLLGPGGSKMLPEELKWLAVTHKSFDQGRRGFNDRLALLGRLTMVMEATKEIVSKEPLAGSILADQFDRQPLDDAQLLAVDNLNVMGPRDVMGKDKLYQLANKVGLLEVVRWKPRLPKRLESSGVEVVLSSAIMAIVGAITLQHGAAVAAQVVRERILAQVPKDN
ncbi:ribonuclease-III-like domain-containing protein [Trichoderma gracile]